MIITTTEFIPGKKVVKIIGLVKGNTVRARHLGKDILAALKNIVGGEIQEYTKLLAEAREQALERMRRNAEDLGANAVICVRFGTSYVMQNAAEFIAYGTAVLVEDE